MMMGEAVRELESTRPGEQDEVHWDVRMHRVPAWRLYFSFLAASTLSLSQGGGSFLTRVDG